MDWKLEFTLKVYGCEFKSDCIDVENDKSRSGIIFQLCNVGQSMSESLNCAEKSPVGVVSVNEPL